LKTQETIHALQGRRLPFRSLLALLAIETVAITVARLPESMDFDRFAFCDHGANLTLQTLISRGMQPALDFGYHYGLLPALVGRIWFSAFGVTPWAYEWAMIAIDLACIWAVARILCELKIGGAALAFALITFGYMVQASYVNFAHGLEAVLLIHALAQQTRGFRTRALALATAALFAKPSMGYVYGLLLVILVLLELRGSCFDLRRLLAAFGPAAAVFAALAFIVSMTFGTRTFLRTIVPLEGLTNYRALNFGLMKEGRGLWDPFKVPWMFYIINVNGLWILSGIFLFGAAAYQALNKSEMLTTKRSEVLISCAALHAAFLLFFFGNQWSLMIGTTVAIAQLNNSGRVIGLSFCALGILSWICMMRWSEQWWNNTSPDRSTAGLWTSATERSEWLQVLSITKGHSTVVLDLMGAAEQLFPGFQEPVSMFMVDGLMTPAEIQRKRDEISNAEIILVPTTKMLTCNGIPNHPEIKSAMDKFAIGWRGKYFEVFRRAGSQDDVNLAAAPRGASR
jgi:hypothetical protein